MTAPRGGDGSGGLPRGRVEDRDVVVIGAGLSGIGTACRLARWRPGLDQVVLDARDRVGGTWDLFRYPGVRSDSDIRTFSYPFRAWDRGGTLAEGADIRAYVEETARENGVDRSIRLGVRVTGAHWESPTQRWTVETLGPDGPGSIRCRFLFVCTGYYDHAAGHEPEFPGRGDFAGVFVHPQHWPDDLDHAGRRVVVIGSGATAATLVPALARTAAHVTMLQRTPSHMASMPSRDPLDEAVARVLPPGAAHRVLRAKNIVLAEALYRYARVAPAAFERLLRRGLARHLPDDVIDAHFVPPYRPWDQRVCRIPEGDLAAAVASGSAEVVTDRIERLVPEGIRLASGRVLPADIVVSATGLELLALGGIDIDVDGERVDVADRLAYRGLALEGVPNLVFTIGYTNASWTLRSDLVARHAVRLLRYMSARRIGVVRPRAASPAQRRNPRPLLGLRSGYVLRAASRLPKLGSRAPWTYRQSYLAECAILGLAPVAAGLDVERARSGCVGDEPEDAVRGNPDVPVAAAGDG